MLINPRTLTRPQMTDRGIQELAVIQQTVRSLRRNVLQARLRTFKELDLLLSQALKDLDSGKRDPGIKNLDSAIALLEAETNLLGT